MGPGVQELEENPAPPIPPSPLSFLHTGFLCLRSENVLVLGLGITILGVSHYTLTVKGSHLATHGALTESKGWSKFWELFFVEVSLVGVEVTAGTVWANLIVHFFFLQCHHCLGCAGAQLCVPMWTGHCSC